MDAYITVRREASGESVVQKSRFIGWAAPCETEEEALSFLRRIREMYRDATHHCYAYVIGANNGIMRYSDDGEPGGTAGLPIMNVLRAGQVVNVCVVVVRYFGGTLLGTGGLVRAYTQGCKDALEAARVVRMERTAHVLCDVPYSVWDPLTHAARSLPVQIQEPAFGTSVTFTLAVRSGDLDRVMDTLGQVTGRKIKTEPKDETFDPWEIGSD